MKVLLIHQAFQPESGAGGTRHFEFGKAFVKHDNEFVVVASNVNYMDASQDDERRSTLAGVDIVRARIPKFIHRGYLWRVLAYVAYMLNSFWAGFREPKVDLVMGTSPSLFQALSAALVSLFRRKTFLLEVRDLWPDFAIDMGVLKSKVLIKIARWIESFLYWQADHILVNSPAYVDYMIDRGIDPKKVSLIPNGVDTSMFDVETDGSRIRKELGLEGKFVVTYAGAIGQANDIPTIVRAAQRLADDPEICIMLVGGGKAESEVRALIKEKGLTNIVMPGTRPKSEMSDVLAASDVCVATLLNIPMFKTVYPNKIFDYMAAEKPIIMGIDGVIREVVEKSDCGRFITPGDDQQLADSVRWMKDNADEAREMGRRGRVYVSEHFNRDVQAADFMKLAQSLVNTDN